MVSRLFKRCVVGVLLLATLGLAGCTTVVWETAKKLRESRAGDAQFTDTKISVNLMSGLAEKDMGLFMDVNADVWESRVLLTGTVTDASIRQEVVRKVRADKRIVKIYDEIQVVSAARQAQQRELAKPHNTSHKNGSPAAENDLWVETKIAAQLVSAPNVVSVNYRWRSVRNILYVIGRAGSRQELSQVLGIIKATDGVTRVKSFVELQPA